MAIQVVRVGDRTYWVVNGQVFASRREALAAITDR